MTEELVHYGILRKSGRYPWGSGENPHQRNKQFLTYVDQLHKKGLSETEIAKGLGITTTQLRASKAIAKTEQRQSQISMATRLKEKGMSNIAIGERMGLNESSVRALLDPANQAKTDILNTTSDMLKDNVDKKGFIDIGSGVENHIGISATKLNTAVAMLEEEGYVVHKFSVEQVGTGMKTNMKVLCPPGTTYPDVLNNKDQINLINDYSEDGGRTYLGLETPKAVSSKRLEVRYGPDGGSDKDGVIELRRGVDDISLGNAKYAQVRISVDGTHYLKGMAMYSDDLPDGVDMIFNTNKTSTGNKMDALKKMKDDEDNPFGAVVRQRHFLNSKGEQELSAINIVNEEGDWGRWSRTLSSQMLSKQSPSLAKEQLGLSFLSKKDQYDEIMSLTNPTVRKKLLDSFADDADSASVHLKAAALPRQRTHVILPINSVKETEIYAPNYRNGEKVVLIRFPHGGKFEIPELTVNNRQREAGSVLKNAIDAVGINSKVASRLSGADFDGDTVLVIPNNSRKVRTSKSLEGLKDFDPQTAYPKYSGMKPMSARTKQLKMGDVSNLITDMTIRGASDSELARAVRHSMVVIDAEKHKLNWKQSAIDNGISELKSKYQKGPRSGASTLISQASAEIRVPDRKPRSAAKGGPIDIRTGRKVYEETGASYKNKAGKTVTKTVKSTKMAEARNAYSLSSGTHMESIYADHANKLKALANQARKDSYSTPSLKYSPSAKAAYSKEVATLNGKLNAALKNQPLERKSQLLANTVVSAKRQANPHLEAEDIKKIKGQALNEARSRTGAKKPDILITQAEWNAIQAGAISNNKLVQILNKSDLDQVKKLANPRSQTGLSGSKLARAKSMLSAGYTQAEVADALGISTSTLNQAI